MKPVKLIGCDNAFRANLIKGALENEGIAAFITNENTATVMRGYCGAITDVQVFVDTADAARAAALLERNGMIPDRLKYCPCCRSADIGMRLRKGRRLKALFAGLVGLLASAPPGTEHWEYVCKDCGARFDSPVAANTFGQEESAPR